ncbi:MAG TPA: hypothetical protein VMQ62_13615 [Dongiaceae bacterium]|nr:hypothetical protein [Dongiaceae bacterium]
MTRNFEVTCPCCETLLVIDPDTGAILREERVHKREHKSLDDALDSVAAKKRESESRLERALEDQKNRDAILEKKFEEARRRAATSTDPPPRPFDGD